MQGVLAYGINVFKVPVYESDSDAFAELLTSTNANRHYQNNEEAFIANAFSSAVEYFKYKEEVVRSGLIEHIENARLQFESTVTGKTDRGNDYAFGALSTLDGIKLYSLVRKFKPKTLVETGVCNGSSTAFILLAMKNNGFGRLYSIDFPEVEGIHYENGDFWAGKGGAAVPKDKTPGWVIPDYLRKNWELILGKSQDKLPELLSRLKTIDFFLHDSEHSYECVKFEIDAAMLHLKPGSLLICDDITWNTAFFEFARKQNRDFVKIAKNTAYMIV
jgi:predicted O-methyltransferase YrrM